MVGRALVGRRVRNGRARLSFGLIASELHSPTFHLNPPWVIYRAIYTYPVRFIRESLAIISVYENVHTIRGIFGRPTGGEGYTAPVHWWLAPRALAIGEPCRFHRPSVRPGACARAGASA